MPANTGFLGTFVQNLCVILNQALPSQKLRLVIDFTDDFKIRLIVDKKPHADSLASIFECQPIFKKQYGNSEYLFDIDIESFSQASRDSTEYIHTQNLLSNIDMSQIKSYEALFIAIIREIIPVKAQKNHLKPEAERSLYQGLEVFLKERTKTELAASDTQDSEPEESPELATALQASKEQLILENLQCEQEDAEIKAAIAESLQQPPALLTAPNVPAEPPFMSWQEKMNGLQASIPGSQFYEDSGCWIAVLPSDLLLSVRPHYIYEPPMFPDLPGAQGEWRRVASHENVSLVQPVTHVTYQVTEALLDELGPKNTPLKYRA